MKGEQRCYQQAGSDALCNPSQQQKQHHRIQGMNDNAV